MRSLLQRTGGAFGLAATAILAGLGYSQLHNIFPVPHNLNWWVWGTLVGLSVAVAIIGSIWIAAIFLRAQRRIVLDSKMDKFNDDLDLNPHESRLAKRIGKDHARQEQAATLHDVELRALRLGNISRRMQPDDSAVARVKAESERLYDVVSIALSRASVAILEERSRRAFHSPRTLAAVGMAAVGIAGVFGIADYFKGERDRVALRVACHKAELAGIKDACAPIESLGQRSRTAKPAAKKPTPASLNEKQLNLLREIAKCDAAVLKRPPKDQPISEPVHAQSVASCVAAAG